MGWSEAYNFNFNDEISISIAMSLREEKDPRAGDLHCHKTCYKKKEGSRLLTRKVSIDKKTGQIKKKAHFARWPNKYDKTGIFCGFAAIAESKRESMDYSMYYHKFDEYLSSLTAKSEPYFIQTVSKNDGENEPDFEISHSKKILNKISRTVVYIIDENKRKKKKYPISSINNDEFIISIRISEYTTQQLIDFKRGGIDRFNLEWDYLINLAKEQINIVVKINHEDKKLLDLIVTTMDDIKNKEKRRFSDPFNEIKSELMLMSLETDSYEELSLKVGTLYSFLEDCKLINYLDEKRYNNVPWIKDFDLETKIRTVDRESYSRIKESGELDKINSDIKKFRYRISSYGPLEISKKIGIKAEVRKLYRRINNKKKEVWRREYPDVFKVRKTEISDKQFEIKHIRDNLREESERMAKMGLFDDPNDPKVIEMLELLGARDYERDIAKLEVEILQIEREIYDT
jgi:hypothetical protein